MAIRSVQNLVNDLRLLSKDAAQSPESCVDPAVKGEPGSVDPKKIIDPLAGQSASLDVPAVTPTEMAGDQKVEQGDAAGEVPAATAFVESGAGAKAAALIGDVGDLRNKLAAIATDIAGAAAEPVVPPPAGGSVAAPDVPLAPASDPAAPAKMAEDISQYIPGDYALKCAFHLLQTPGGQGLMLGALEEVVGATEAVNMVKAAADEQVAFLRQHTVEQFQRAAEQEAQSKQAAEQAAAERQYQELMKNASPEERANIERSSFIMKRAAAMFEQNPSAHYAVCYGLSAAQKVAAAMEAGMDPAAAGASAAGPTEGEVSPEELIQAIDALVQQGVIKEEEAAQILQEIMGGGAGAEGGMLPPGAEGGMPPGAEGGMPPGAEEIPEGEDPAAYAEKAAAADTFLQNIASLVTTP